MYFSRDPGESWEYAHIPEMMGGESQAAELNDGSLMMNCRSSSGYRKVPVTSDLGRTWDRTWLEEQLPDPACNASIHRYASVLDGDAGNVILIANLPSSTAGDRTDLTVRIRYDEGDTWPASRQIYDGSSATSSMAVLPDDSIAILFQRASYTAISFVRVTLDALTD